MVLENEPNHKTPKTLDASLLFEVINPSYICLKPFRIQPPSQLLTPAVYN